MSDTTEMSVEDQARSIGWLPKEEFQGNEANWVDAQTYVERGETVVPYLKADRRKLFGEVEQLKGALSSRDRELAELKESVEILKQTTNQERIEQLETEAKELRLQLREARRSDDAETEIEIEDRIETNREALREAKAKPAVKPQTGGQQTPPPDAGLQAAIDQFKRENPWYDADPAMRAAAHAMIPTLATAPDYNTVTAQERFRRLSKAVAEKFKMDQSNASATTRVEGSGGNGSQQSSGGGAKAGAKTFANLPADAKAQIEKQTPKMVGPNRAFKTVDEWKAHFVKHWDWRQ